MNESAYLADLQQQAASLLQSSLPAAGHATGQARPAPSRRIGTDQQDFPEVYVNGVRIEPAAIGREMQYHQASHADEAKWRSAQALVIRELLRQDCLRHQPEGAQRWQDDEEAALAARISGLVSAVQVSEADCQHHLDQHPACHLSAPAWEVRHILLAADPADGEARLSVRAQAQTLIASLTAVAPVAQASAFADLALAHSVCPSRQDGGRLGCIGPGDTVPEFEKALQHLSTGLHRSPVESRYGWHVLWVDALHPGQPLPLPVVRERVRRYLTERASRQMIADHLARLVAEAQIEGITLDATRTL